MMNSNTREYERIFLKRGYARFYIKDYRNTWSRSMYPGKLAETKDVSCIGADAVCESDLRYCPDGLHTLLRSYLEKDRILAKIQALVSYARCPQIETLYKIGLNGICTRILWKEGVTKEINNKKNLRIVFSESSAFEPVIANMILKFNEPVNILKANTKNVGGVAKGEMILGFREDNQKKEEMKQYLIEKGLEIEEVDNYVD